MPIDQEPQRPTPGVRAAGLLLALAGALQLAACTQAGGASLRGPATPAPSASGQPDLVGMRVRVQEVAKLSAPTGIATRPSSFGVDPTGELYAASLEGPLLRFSAG
jgi:hypothetical protein